MLQNLQSTELVYPGTQVLRSGVISGRDTSRPNVQRRYFGYAQRRAAPMELPESGFRRALGIELTVHLNERGKVHHCVEAPATRVRQLTAPCRQNFQ